MKDHMLFHSAGVRLDQLGYAPCAREEVKAFVSRNNLQKALVITTVKVSHHAVKLVQFALNWRIV